VSGHYDTVARQPGGVFDWTLTDNPAPGVNDDGSGTAVVLELARVFAQSGLTFDATLVFIAFAGEEQGLVGAKLHAQKASAEKWTIDGILNNDIVGGVSGGGASDSASVRVFSEGPEDSPSRQLARAVRRHAARYVPGHQVRLIARHDRFGRGGDHTAFNQHGFAGVRFTESKENFARQHVAEDTFEGVSPAYLARNARVNAAALAVLALAPPAPVVVDERGRPLLDRQPSGYDARLRWTAAPGAAAYRIFWRDTWTPDWQHERLVGAVTEVVLPGVSIDDHVFGVAAVGPDGHESVVSAYVNPPRAEQTIKTHETN
jgi:Zn-dependent M28 family amino/carboxypeptidase